MLNFQVSLEVVGYSPLSSGNLGTIALLASSNKFAQTMPWTKLVIADLHVLYAFHSRKLSELGDPAGGDKACMDQ